MDGFVSVGVGSVVGLSGGVRLVLFLTCGCGESCLGVLCHDVSLGHGGLWDWVDSVFGIRFWLGLW